MKLLGINCGSSTLKFRVFEVGMAPTGRTPARRRADGIVNRIGGLAKLEFTAEAGQRLEVERDVRDHGEATRLALDWLRSLAAFDIDAVGHRVVHGGPSFTEPVVIDDNVITGIEKATSLAPLHNAATVAAIRTAREMLGTAVPMVATFDTAFYANMPERASQYAIPRGLAEKHGIRRYGFHGLAHRYMAERYAELTSRAPEQVRLVTLQLGNGCSATALNGGRPVDTLMGLTPLEGLVMGTRSGDLDPSIVARLATAEGIFPEQAVSLLNTKSGLLGVSGRSSDMRELLTAEEEGDKRAVLAVELFCYRAKKYVGSYFAALAGADAVIFGGGIGENAPGIRARICGGMEWCGLRLDPAWNDVIVGAEGRISDKDSRVAAYVLPVDEERIIALDTMRCLDV